MALPSGDAEKGVGLPQRLENLENENGFREIMNWEKSTKRNVVVIHQGNL